MSTDIQQFIDTAGLEDDEAALKWIEAFESDPARKDEMWTSEELSRYDGSHVHTFVMQSHRCVKAFQISDGNDCNRIGTLLYQS